MRRIMLFTSVFVVAVAMAVPASATVHEIVGQWCSGQEELNPPGITGGSNADNFAKPLMANGFVGDPVFVPALGGLLIPFNFDHPASKVIGTGEFFQIDALPDGTPIFIEGIAPDPSFPAFSRCVNIDIEV